MEDLERRVLEAIDVPALVEFLCELVTIESTGGRESPAQERVAALMRELGMEVDAWEIDLAALRADPAYCAEIDREHALGVVGRTGAGRGGAENERFAETRAVARAGRATNCGNMAQSGWSTRESHARVEPHIGGACRVRLRPLRIRSEGQDDCGREPPVHRVKGVQVPYDSRMSKPD